jgi:hypothetical protein
MGAVPHAVVGERRLDDDPLLGERGGGAMQEVDAAAARLVIEDLGIRQSRMVVDRNNSQRVRMARLP